MNNLVINEKEVSLFQLKTELVGLMQLREEPELSDEERAAIDGQIKAYVSAELRKADNIIGYLRHCAVMKKAANEEARRVTNLEKMWENREQRLKDLCQTLMIEFGEKRLEGQRGAIMLKGNGGLQGLDLAPALLPEEFVLYRGWMSSEAYAAIPEQIRGRQDFQFEREPKQGAIREALNKPCPWRRCEGKDPECPHCGGDGKYHVTGARLRDRGSHIEIR